MQTLTITSIDTIGETAKEFVSLLGDKKIVAFYGGMGAGKTSFIKAICEEKGVIDLVNSPTFAIINDYLTKTDEHIYHFDFYRLNGVEDALNIGTEEYFYSGNYCFLEWPEIIEPILPEETLIVTITVNENNERIIEF